MRTVRHRGRSTERHGSLSRSSNAQLSASVPALPAHATARARAAAGAGGGRGGGGPPWEGEGKRLLRGAREQRALLAAQLRAGVGAAPVVRWGPGHGGGDGEEDAGGRRVSGYSSRLRLAVQRLERLGQRMREIVKAEAEASAAAKQLEELGVFPEVGGHLALLAGGLWGADVRVPGPQREAVELRLLYEKGAEAAKAKTDSSASASSLSSVLAGLPTELATAQGQSATQSWAKAVQSLLARKCGASAGGGAVPLAPATAFAPDQATRAGRQRSEQSTEGVGAADGAVDEAMERARAKSALSAALDKVIGRGLASAPSIAPPKLQAGPQLSLAKRKAAKWRDRAEEVIASSKRAEVSLERARRAGRKAVGVR